MRITRRLDLLLVVIAFLVYGNFVVWRQSVQADTTLPLRFVTMNIGQGDALYIEAPNGRQMVIDGGPDAKTISHLRSVMPYGDDSIDVIVITNPDADHMAGFEQVMENYKIGLLVESGTHANTATYQRIQQAVLDRHIPVQLARAGESIVLDDEHGVRFDILFPDRDASDLPRNDGSIVGKLIYGKTSYMLMGDATAKTESMILAKYPAETLRSDILKLGHHGSRTSSSEAWLEAVQPKEAVYSAGCHNSYGHPHTEVINRLDMLKIKHLGTCENGDIEIDSNGRMMHAVP